MNKILTIRIILISAICAMLQACGTGPEKRVNEPEGPFSARARNILASENPEGLLRVGEGFERSGNLRGALNIYGQAMAAAPHLVEAHIAYARITGKLGASDRSISMFMTLLEEHPNNVKVRTGLANAYIRAGQFRTAMLLLTPLLEEEKTSPELLDLGGRLAQVSGDPVLSRKLLSRALSLQPENPVYLRHLALSFALEQDYATAIALLQKAMDKSAGLIPGKQSLAMVYALSGQFGTAMQLARGSMLAEEVNARQFIYRNIPNWTKEQQAMAVLFNQYPRDLLKTRGSAAK